MKEVKVKKKKKLYEGETKILYETDHEELLLLAFKDDVAGDGGKKGKVKGKGAVNNQVAAHLFKYLESYHVPTHFVGLHSDHAMVVRKLEMLPFVVVMHNVATGGLVKRSGSKEGQALEKPLLEFYRKEDKKYASQLEEKAVLEAGSVNEEELVAIERMALKINAVLKAFFQRRGLRLVNFRLEFGRYKAEKLVLADELSPDTCRLWDAETGEKYDPERLRKDAGKIEEAYEEVRRRVFSKPGAVAA